MQLGWRGIADAGLDEGAGRPRASARMQTMPRGIILWLPNAMLKAPERGSPELYNEWDQVNTIQAAIVRLTACKSFLKATSISHQSYLTG